MVTENDGFDVFLSHSSRDKPAVEAIAERLRAEEGLRPFLDKWHLPPGAPWQDELIAALDESASVAVFVGPSGSGPWQDEELRLALNRSARNQDDFRVIPVLLPGADGTSIDRFLAQRTWVDFAAGLDDADALKRLAAGVRGEAFSNDAFELPDDPAPYRGLFRFEAEHAPMFFGRDEDTRRLIDKLNVSAFAVVVGASGSGKSSLVRAGLLPNLDQLRTSSGAAWHRLLCLPGSDPNRSLAEQIARLDPAGTSPSLVDQLAERFASRDDGVITAVNAYNANDARPVLIVIDQFEELFTLASDRSADERTIAPRFVANLANAAADSTGVVKIVATMRADFVARALAVDGLAELLEDNQLMLGALTGSKLREAIVQPAKQVGAMFEKGLVSTIIADVDDEPGALPLLQHALYELWTRRRGPWLTVDAYEASGGVIGALSTRAQSALDALSPEQQHAARRIFLRLTTFGEGVPDTRRRASRRELYPAGTDHADVDEVLRALSGESARLIVSEEDSVEVAHEALLRSWGTLRGWLDENREDLRVHRRLSDAASEWADEHDRDPASLYRGARLAEANDFAAAHAGELNDLEAEFVRASADRAGNELLEERRRSDKLKRRLVFAVVGVVVALAGVVVSIVSVMSANDSKAEAVLAASQAEQSSAAAVASGLAIRSEQASFRSPSLAALLARHADELAPSDETTRAMLGAVFSPWQKTLSTKPVSIIRSSPDGQSVLTVDEDGVVVWDAAGDAVVLTSDPASEAVFTADATHIVTTDEAGARVWTIGGELVEDFPSVETAFANSDGSRVVSKNDGGVVLWEAGGGSTQIIADPAIGGLLGLSPDGSQIVTKADDGAVLWDGSGNLLRDLTVDGGLDTVSFAPDSTVFVTSGGAGAQVWNAQGDQIADLTGSSTASASSIVLSDEVGRVVTTGSEGGEVWSIDGERVGSLGSDAANPSFSPGGSRLLTAGDDGVVERDADGNKLSTLTPTFVSSAVFVGNGNRFITAGDVGVALWDVDGNRLPTQAIPSVDAAVFAGRSNKILTGGFPGVTAYGPAGDSPEIVIPEDVHSVASNPDGSLIVTKSDERTVLWDAEGNELRELERPESTFGFRFGSVAFSPDGKWILATGVAGVTVWTSEGTDPREIPISLVRTARFSPDSTRILTAALSGVDLWNIDGEPVEKVTSQTYFAADFAADNTRVITAGESGTVVWDLNGGRRLTLSTSPSESASFSADGGRIVTTGRSGVVVWDSAGNRLATFPVVGTVDSVAFSHDGSRILISGESGVSVWHNWTGQALRNELDRRIGTRQFTSGECVTYEIDPCPG